MRIAPVAILLSCALAACADDDTSPGAAVDPTADAGSADAAGVDASGADAGTEDALADASEPDAEPEPTPTCSYVNPFSSSAECKRYLGADWTEESIASDCEAPFPGADPGALGTSCGFDAELGRCDVQDAGDSYELVFAGDDPDLCGATVTGCEVFGGGEFIPSAVCTDGGGGGGALPGVFLAPFESCVAPLDGEPSGQSEAGEVCTNVAISGATEAGRSFAEYGDCEVVFTQRPYYPVPPAGTTDPEDPRLEDEAYLAEVEWARQQVASTGCVCCHAVDPAPSGPSTWYIDEPLWLDTVSDTGLALFAGWADSTSLGAYPAEDNNGFDREALGLPTTDIDRMRTFIEGELARRGVERDDPEVQEPFGGPIYDQLVYTPGACNRGEGVDAEGLVNWTGTPARYVYVLDQDAANPGVPPNLDTPTGTVWRLDVDPSADALDSGVAFGSVPDGTVQRVPAEGAPPELQSGETYYLYVLLDVGVPLTRCLFEAP